MFRTISAVPVRAIAKESSMPRPLAVVAFALVATVATVAAVGVVGAWAGQDPAPYVQNEPRAMSRVVFFGGGGLAGEYSIQYGKPAWKPEYDQNFEKMTRGQRMRLGKDWWTSLETFGPLTFGEKTELAEGSWFLALECSAKGEWSLVALDPAPLRKSRMDAFATAKTTGGTMIPMQYETVAENEPDLRIQFVADAAKPREQTLEIRFGKHRLSTRVVAKL
jgi:hypothetical protein